MSSIEFALTQFDAKDVIISFMMATLIMAFSTFAMSVATFIMVVNFTTTSHSQVTAEKPVEDYTEEVQDAEEVEAEVTEQVTEQVTEVQEERVRLAVSSGHELGLKKKGAHKGIGLVESGNGQVFRVIHLTTGTFAGTIQLHAVGGDDVNGKALDNYHQDNDHLCLYKYCRDNNRAQNWKRNGNKLISMVTGKLSVKVNGEYIGFSQVGDDITFIPV